MARLILLDLMHLVHTLALLTVPLSLILTDWIFAFHFLLVCLLEWETVLPETCPFPHTSHFLDIYRTSFKYLKHVAYFQNFVFVHIEQAILYHKKHTQGKHFFRKLLEIFYTHQSPCSSRPMHINDTLILTASKGQGQITQLCFISSIDKVINQIHQIC